MTNAHDEHGEARVIAFPGFVVPEGDEVLDADVVEDGGGDEPGGAGNAGRQPGTETAYELLPYVAHLPAVRPVPISEARLVPTRADALDWLDRCRGGLELTTKVTAFHATRSPLYAGRAARRWHRGFARGADAWWSWVRAHADLDVITQLVNDPQVTGDKKQQRYADAWEHRKRKVNTRWAVTLILTFTALALAWRGWHDHRLLTIFVGAVILMLLGMFGAPGEVVTHLEMPPQQMVLSPDLLVSAFFEAGVTKQVPVEVAQVPFKTDGGWTAKVKLPPGVTVDDVVRNKVKLASGLDCPRDSLDIDALPFESERMIGIFVALEHPSAKAVPEWPLLSVDRWDVWRPVPVGYDVRGQVVTLSLLWVMTLLGAAMQRGKTTLMRLLAIAALLDPRVELIIADFKGGVDWIPYKPWCKQFIHGPSAESVEAFSDLIDSLEAEYQRRMAAISEMPLSEVPQGRITPAMAERAGFHPIIVMVDEAQRATQSKNGKSIVERWSELQKVCPASGITFVAATQKPDSRSVPTELRDAFLQRVALSVATRHASEAVLGTEAYQVGLNAAALGGRPGIGICWSQDSDAGPGFRGQMRVPNCTPEMAEAMLQRVARVRGRRPAAAEPTVTVEASNLDGTDDPVPDIVRWVLKDWPYPDERVHQVALAEHMGMSQKQLGDQLRAVGLEARGVKVDGTNRNGYVLDDVQALRDRYAR